MAALSRLRSATETSDQKERRAETLDVYVRTAPGAGNAIDIFKGQWASKLPAPYERPERAASHRCTKTRACTAALEVLGACDRASGILELGPLEGGHTYLLDRSRRGAHPRHRRQHARVPEMPRREGTARHAGRALRLWRLHGVSARARRSAWTSPSRSGVLYHMMSPVELLARLARHRGRPLPLDALLRRDPAGGATARRPPRLSGRTRPITRASATASTVSRTVPRSSGATSAEATAPRHVGCTRADIVSALAHFGYTRVHPYYEQPDHPHGPAFSVVAQR